MFCTKCSFPLEEEDLYCSRCGSATGEAVGAQSRNGQPLTRCTGHRKVAGICEGFARHFDVDVTLVRLGWVGASLLPLTPGLVAYLVCWAVMPREDTVEQQVIQQTL